MPNWCNNTLMLNEDSNTSILEVVKDYLGESGHLSFEKIRPIPNELKETTSPTPKDIDPNVQKMLVEKYGHDNWYDWCVENWGTKWDADVHHADEKAICFTTAWSPPIGIVKTLSKLTGKDFRLTYIEEGIDFCGEYFSYPEWMKNHDHEHSPISSAPDTLKEELCGEEWTCEDEEDKNEIN